MRMYKLVPPKSENLGPMSTMSEILAKRLIPGPEGVILDQRTVVFSHLWSLTRMIGVEISLTKDYDMLSRTEVFRLRSGNQEESPITKPMHGLLRILAHTHPSGNTQRLPSEDDLKHLNALFLHKLRSKADAALPHSRVIWGGGKYDFTIFWPTDLR